MTSKKTKALMEKNALAMRIGLNIIVWITAIFFIYLLIGLLGLTFG